VCVRGEKEKYTFGEKDGVKVRKDREEWERVREERARRVRRVSESEERECERWDVIGGAGGSSWLK
jgi:hypothetical protein